MKIFTTLIITVLMASSANASINEQNADEAFKKECQYEVYGNGESIDFVAGMMSGIVKGAVSMIPKEESTNFLLNSTIGTIKLKACQKTLNNITPSGFRSDYKSQVIKLISIKDSDRS